MSDRRENWIGLLSFGFFLMLFALFFIIVPDYYTRVDRFIHSFEMQEVVANIYLPAPQGSHPVVYDTVMWFSIIFGAFQGFVLGLRFYLRSSVEKKAETTSNVVIWFGGAYMFHLLSSGALASPEWFRFIGGIIAVLGLALIVRSLMVLLFSE